jgi:Spy/CpxP family protein refolding chaperone
MSRLRLLGLAGLMVLAELVVLAPPAIAQQAATAPAQHAMVLPSVDEHLKMLSEKLGLTADQQEKVRPIIAEMQDGLQKVMDDKSLTREQMHEQSHQVYMTADKKLREFLTDEQKTKLDDLERPHQEIRGQQ